MEKGKRNKYLAQNVVVFALGSIGTKLISFFLVPLYTNILSTSEYGIIDFISTICTIIVPVLTLNISEAVLRFCLDKDSNFVKIICIGISVLVLGSIVGLGIIPISNCFESYRLYSSLTYLYVLSFSINQLFLCYLRGREQVLDYAIGSIIQAFFMAVLNIFFLLYLKIGIKGYLYAYILSNIITAFFAIIRGNVFREIKDHFTVDYVLLKKMVQYSFFLIPNSLMWWIMNSSDRIMVIWMIGSSANGIYSISYKIPTLMSTLSTIFTQAWSYSAIREEESGDKDEYTNRIFNYLFSFVSLVAICLITFIKQILKYYVGSSFYESWKYTPYLIIGYVFMTLGSFLSTSYTVHKDSKGFLISGTIGAVLNATLNFILIPRIGVHGAALATCISYIAVFFYRIKDTRKYVKNHLFGANNTVLIGIMIVEGGLMFVNGWGFYAQLLLLLIAILINKGFIFDLISLGKHVVRGRKRID